MTVAPHLFEHPGAEPQTLVDVLDRLLDRGVVVAGDLKISVADVDLLFVGLQVFASSIDGLEDAHEARRTRLSAERAGVRLTDAPDAQSGAALR